MKTHLIASVLTTLFLTFSQKATAQIPQFEWAANLEWVNAIYINGVTTDTDSSVIIVGYFSGWQDLDPGSAQLLVDGQEDIFVLKVDKNGVLEWVQVIGSESGFMQQGLSIVADSNNNVYVNGTWPSSTDSTDFDPGPGEYKLYPESGVTGFVFSLDPNGNFRWANLLPGYTGNYNEIRNNFQYDASGQILITESFSGTKDFDPGPGTFFMTTATSALYILSLDLDGNFVWSKSIDDLDAQAITSNGNGDIFVSGEFQGTVDFDPGTGVSTLTSTGPLTDCFVIKLTATGDYVWAKAVGGTQFDFMYDLACGDNGQVYASGTYQGTADLDPGMGAFSNTAVDDEDNFVISLDSQGDFVWGWTMPDSNWVGYVHLDTDINNNLYMSSNFTDSIDMDPSINEFNLASSFSPLIVNNPDFFFSKISPSGNLIWVESIGGEVNDDVRDLHVAENQDIHLVGDYDETVDFDPGTGVDEYTSIGAFDGFNIKFAQCFQSSPTPDIAALSDVTSDCQVNNIIPPTASEFCTGTITGVPDVTFPITTQGTTTVTWAYDAGNGFVSTQTQNVIISDNTPPTPNQANLPDINAQCEVDTIIPPTATDNCLGNVTITSDAVLPITTNTTVTWTYEDENGNATTQSQNVIVMDTNPPLPDLTNLADIDSDCPITSLTSPTATDNCSGTVSATNNATLPITSSTTVTWTYDDGNGNISTQAQNINIIPIDVSTTLNLLMDNTQEISANASGYSYQWIEDCGGTNSPIAGATIQSFIPSSNGSYAVIISNGACSDTSDCVIIDDLNLETNYLTNVEIWPNPSGASFFVTSNEEIESIKIFNLAGQIIPFTIETSQGVLEIQIHSTPGAYVVQLNTLLGHSHHCKILKK